MPVGRRLRAGLLAGAVSVLFVIPGCRRAPGATTHTVQQLTAVSAFRSEMDRDASFSLLVRREGEQWLLSGYDGLRELDEGPLDPVQAQRLLLLVEQEGLIATAENSKKSTGLFPWATSDQGTCGFCLRFADGSEYEVSRAQRELERLLLELARQQGA